MSGLCRGFYRFATGCLLSFGLVAGARAQTDCAVPQGSTRSQFPRFSGTLPVVLTTAGGSNYLYALTQYGIARASLAAPASPGPLLLGQVGLKTSPEHNGGKVRMLCDCWAGGSMLDVAEAPNGGSRMISDWGGLLDPLARGGQVVRADGTGSPAFAQQVDVTIGGYEVAAIYLAGSQKFIGYFPSPSSVQIVDLTTTNGEPDPNQALRPFSSLAWRDVTAMKAARVQVPNYDKSLLAGATATRVGETWSLNIRIAEVDPNTGNAIQVAQVPAVGPSLSLYIATVNGRIFIFSADDPRPGFIVDPLRGLQVYEFVPSPPSLVLRRSILGNFSQVVVKGWPGAPFPAIFANRGSFLDIYDTNFLTQPGAPRRAYSLRNFGEEQGFLGDAVDAVVTRSGSVVTAHVYRLVAATCPPPACEHSVRTDKLDISCIAVDPNAPPVANAVATNLSAAARTAPENSINYYGDRWRLQDASASFHPLLQIEWDFNAPTSPPIVPDESRTLPDTSATDINPAYLPCDPSNGGIIRTGFNCHGSLGNPTSGSYRYGLRTRNQVAQNGGWSEPHISPAIAVVAPQARIAGLDTTTIPPTLRVLSGVSGNADARDSQGNTAEATFRWNFGATELLGQRVTVPAGATEFTLEVTYNGGYVTRVPASGTGTVLQVDLVPAFRVSPNPVLVNGTLTVTNEMQIGAATLTSVDWAISSSPTPPEAFTGQLAAAFHAVNGTATLVAPGPPAASYHLHLRYNYTGSGCPHSCVSRPFSTTSFTPTPVVGVYLDSGRSQPAPFFGGAFNLTTGTPYFVFDIEPLPDGITHPGTQWLHSTDGTNYAAIGNTVPPNGAGPLPYTPASPCSSCYLKAVVSGSEGVRRINVSSPGPPPDPGPGPLTVSVVCPSTATTGTPVTCTASSAGGSGAVTFAWRWGDSTFANYVAGPATNSYTYLQPGSYGVSVRATDSAGATATASSVITITGNPAPSSAHTLAGATLNSSTNEYDGRVGRTITFTAGELNASKWEWDFGDGTTGSGRTVQKTYSSAGMWTVRLTVTGSGTTSGTSTASITLRIVAPRPSEDFALEGRRRNEAGAWEVEVNVPVRFKAAEANAASYQWDFGDQTTASGREVEKTFTATGARTVRLTIQGNNTQTAGTTTLSFNVSIQTCATGLGNLCLNRNRFRVTVTAKNPRDGSVGTGVTLPKKDAFGFFSFPELTRDAENAEVFVKILDGTRINGFYWLFRGAMTDFELDYTIRDTVTGAVKTYHKDAGPSCGSFDTEAFPAGSGSDSVSAAALSAISVNITGPSSAGRASPVTFTASVSGESGEVTYAWKASQFLSLEPFVNGSNTFTHTFETLGKQWVSVRVRDSSGAVAYTETEVNVTGQTGPSLPSASFSVTGAILESPGVYKGSVETPIKFTAAEEKAGSWTWDFGDSTTATGREVTKTYTTGGTRTVRLTVTGNGTDTVGTAARSITLDLVACAAGPNSLCLQKGRFRVRLEAKDPRSGRTGAGEAFQESDTFGYFTLASLTGDPNNPEVFMKLLDGRTFNQRFWVFGDVLSDMETTLTVTDTETGQVATYRKESGRACGGILDVQAFPRP